MNLCQFTLDEQEYHTLEWKLELILKLDKSAEIGQSE